MAWASEGDRRFSPVVPAAGSIASSGAAERLSLAWLLHLRKLLRRDGDFVVRTPGLLPAAVLERSGYAEHFPQNVLWAVPEVEGSGEGGSSDAYAAELALSPACCLHLYAELAGSALPAAGVHGVVYGPCGRYEGGRWSDSRLAHFTMLEWVGIGSADTVAEVDRTLPAKVSAALEALGLPVDWIPATDPFFAGEGSGPAVLQRMTEAKHEWRSAEGVALGSANRHGDTYGRRFDIRVDGAPAHSMCVAFGIERLARASLAAWGTGPQEWPEEFRAYGPLL